MDEDFCGTVVLWPTATPPNGWVFCNGQFLSVGTYPTLFALIGIMYGGNSTFFKLPNFNGATVQGSNQKLNCGATGGYYEVNMDLTNMPTHTHKVLTSASGFTATGKATGNAYYVATGNLPVSADLASATIPGSTAVPAQSVDLSAMNSSNYIYAAPDNATFMDINLTPPNTGQQLSGSIGVWSANPAMTTDVGHTGGAAPINILPPYIALNYIIKVVGQMPPLPAMPEKDK